MCSAQPMTLLRCATTRHSCNGSTSVRVTSFCGWPLSVRFVRFFLLRPEISSFSILGYKLRTTKGALDESRFHTITVVFHFFSRTFRGHPLTDCLPGSGQETQHRRFLGR